MILDAVLSPAASFNGPSAEYVFHRLCALASREPNIGRAHATPTAGPSKFFGNMIGSRCVYLDRQRRFRCGALVAYMPVFVRSSLRHHGPDNCRYTLPHSSTKPLI